MSTLEIMVLITLVPVCFGAILPQARRPKRWAWLPIFALNLAVIHLLSEGWRLQMTPAYGLIAIRLITDVPLLLGKKPVEAEGKARLIPIALGCLTLIAAVIWCLVVPRQG